MAAKPKTIDEYLSRLPEDQRAALEKLRAMIHAAAPGSSEAINYSIPMIRTTKMLVGFGARKEHCALYVMSNTTLAGFTKELAGYDISMGTVRFTPDKPLPATLVKKLVKARLAEQKEVS